MSFITTSISLCVVRMSVRVSRARGGLVTVFMTGISGIRLLSRNVFCCCIIIGFFGLARISTISGLTLFFVILISRQSISRFRLKIAQ